MFFAADLSNSETVSSETVKSVRCRKSPYNTVMERRVLDCLKRGPMTTEKLGVKILGRSVTYRRPVIATLHKMASDGLILHHKDGDTHIWELTNSYTIRPIMVPV